MSDEDGNMENMEGEEQENMEGEEKEEEEKEPTNPLKEDMLKKSLSRISKTYNGLSYAFTSLSIVEKELDDIGPDLENFCHLRDINLSNNKFRHIRPLENMNYLVRIDCSKNEIKEMDIFKSLEKLQFLQILNLSHNKIKELPELNLTALRELNLENNMISDAKEFKGLPSLKKLNLKQNRLKDCLGMANCPELDVLYLTENKIKSLEGIQELPKLRKLRLGNNALVTFDSVPNLPALEKLDMKENQVANVKEFGKLKFPLITKILCNANPCAEDGGAIKTDILILFEDFNIKFINKEEVTKEEREEAIVVKQDRIKKDAEELEEKMRLDKEREEEEEKIRQENEEKLKAEREEEEKLKAENDAKEKEEREEKEKNNPEPDMKDLGNISGIDSGENMGGDFGDENM